MVHNSMNGGVTIEQDRNSDHGVEIKTNPATPVKVENNSASSSRASTRDE
jgi:hypothetical protein